MLNINGDVRFMSKKIIDSDDYPKPDFQAWLELGWTLSNVWYDGDGSRVEYDFCGTDDVFEEPIYLTIIYEISDCNLIVMFTDKDGLEIKYTAAEDKQWEKEMDAFEEFCEKRYDNA